MNITFEDFGKTKYGEIVKKYTIKNALGGELSVLDYGYTVQAIKVPDKNGNIKDVCLGFDTLIEYEENDAYLGAVVGRYANRIGKGRFVLDVSNTPFDFRTEKKIGQDINQKHYQIMYGNGYDHNFVINHKKEWSHCAVAFSEETGIELKLYTTKPGVQLYTANYMEERRGKNNTIYRQRDGFCLETQFFPDSINHKCFPSPVLETKAEYRQKTEYAFGIRDRNRR